MAHANNEAGILAGAEVEDIRDEDAQPHLRPVRRAIAPGYYWGKKNDDPQMFIDSFEQIALANSWDDRMKILQLPSHLKGFAQAWIQGLSRRIRRGEIEDPTWEEYVRLFLLESTEGLYSASEEQALYRRKQRPDEAILSYFYSIDSLCDRVQANMSDEKRLFFLMQGMLPKYFEKVNLVPTTTMEAMRQMLTRISESEEKCKVDDLTSGIKNLELFRAEQSEVKDEESSEQEALFGRNTEKRRDRPALATLKSSERFGRPFAELQEERPGSSPTSNKLEQRIQQLESAMAMSADPPPPNQQWMNNGIPKPPPRTNAPSGRHPLQCWRCNRFGHFASECSEPRQGNIGQGGNGRSGGGPWGRPNNDRRAGYMVQTRPTRGGYKLRTRPAYSAERGARDRQFFDDRKWQRNTGSRAATTQTNFTRDLCRICGKDHPLNQCSFRLENSLNGSAGRTGIQNPFYRGPARH